MNTIGKYQIIDRVGSGGFAVVYKGYDPFIKRPVAIKVCYSRDEETRERFHREAEIAGRLVHKNITTVYDFGLQDQMPYLVEEYLSGEDLAHMIQRREPEVLEEKLDYLIQIASGLDFAHAQGVIHRDIKPSNVRVLDNGRVKIMDFGTAKLAGVESNLTQTGMTLGTVAYLAPERLQGHAAGANSDLFSFGVLAYELLTFERPFQAENIPLLIDAVLNDEPRPIHTQWPECPPALDRIVTRCLIKDPAERYRSCSETIRDLEDFRDERTALVRRPAPQQPTDVTETLVLQEAEMVSVLFERARQLAEQGKPRRAAALLEEVLESDPDNADARTLLATAREQAEAVHESATAEATPERPSESPEMRRERKLAEAIASIEGYLERGHLLGAVDALRFAVHLMGEFPQMVMLRRKIASACRGALIDTRRAGHETANHIAIAMRSLHQAGRLPRELAEHFVEQVHDLDPNHLGAREVLAKVRQEDTRPQDDTAAKQAEAVASIERLLTDGQADMADQALQFAVGLFGEFEQVASLRKRIQLLQRQG